MNDLDRLYGMYRGFERKCPHGVHHPAVEELLLRPDEMILHGCDGCPCNTNYIGALHL